MRPPEFDRQRVPPAQVHHPVLKGRQSVAGLWFPSDWLSEPLRARRIVEAWRPGAQAFRFAQGDLLRFAAPISLDCDEVDGWPLRREGSTLCSAELDAQERAALSVTDLWLVQGGEVLPLQLAQAAPLDASLWLAAGPMLRDTFDCRETLPPPVVLDAGGCTVREVLGEALPPASAEQMAFLQAMAQREHAQSTKGAWRSWSPGSAGRFNPVVLLKRGLVAILGALAERLHGGAGAAQRPAASTGGGFNWLAWGLALLGLWLLRLFVEDTQRVPSTPAGTGTATGHAGASAADTVSLWPWLIVLLVFVLVVWGLWRWLVHWVRHAPAADAGQGAPSGPAQQVPAGPAIPAPSPIEQRGGAEPRRSRWRDWVTRLALASRLSRLIGGQQAAYLQRMLRMFDDGDLMEALRHAIPLGSENDGTDVGQAFGTPGRRDHLGLSRTIGTRSSIYLDPGFEEHLRQLYRRSFEKLDREGRIDEAVFVLAELLQARHEALDYLVKRERYGQAAELALSWDRPPEVIVRLLCLAGDWRRAIAVARRDNAFAAAVLQLQPKWPEMANRLRVEWGQALAQRGEWLKAVDAIWPVAAERQQAVEWLLAAEAADGQLAARALVQRALLLPDTLDVCAPRLRAVRDDPALHRERAALAAELIAVQAHNEASRGLVAVLMPALLADHARGHGRIEKRVLQVLMRLNADPLLQADLPGGDMPGFEPRPLLKQGAPLLLDAPAAGAHAVHDAVLLGEDRYLLALGEAGAVMTDGSGRVQARFAVPAYRLVGAHSGQVALALAERDGLWRVSRLDLVQRQIVELGLAEIDHFAGEFDGIGWTVAHGRRVQVLDTGRSLRDVLWQVSDLPGPVTALSTTRFIEQFVVLDEALGPCLWRYHCPQRRLLGREPIAAPIPEQETIAHLLHPSLGALYVYIDGTPEKVRQNLSWRLESGEGGRVVGLAAPITAIRIAVDREWLAVMHVVSGAWHAQWFELKGGRLAAAMPCPGGPPRLRSVADGWLMFDDEGRVLHLDTERGTSTGFAIR